MIAEWRSGRGQAAVFPEDPHAVQRLVARALPEQPSQLWREELAAIVRGCRRNDSPRYWAYILGSGDDLGVAGAGLAAALHQNVTAWRSAPSAVELEELVVSWLGELIGFNRSVRPARGYLVGGGSQANLAALAMARTRALPRAGAEGLRGGPIPGVYASVETHMSIGKACDLLGLGRSALRRIAIDEHYRLRVAELQESIERDLAAGVAPVAVVANAGTVNTGAVDDVTAIADLCRARGIWLHVDGAYGAPVAAVRPQLAEALARADSLSMDAHKWLHAPVGTGCLLYRDESSARAAFELDTAYTKDGTTRDGESFAVFDVSPELSRPFRALPLWLMLRARGAEAFRASIARNLDQAQRLVARIEASGGDLELTAPVDLSIVCFRVRGDDATNRRVLAEVQRRGRVYLSGTELGGRFTLRASLTNARTTDADLDLLVEEVLTAG